MDAGSNNWNEREGNYQDAMVRQGIMEKEKQNFRHINVENIDTL